MQNRFSLLVADGCLYTWSCLDILITMHFSINCSTVICSPTVNYAILREATSETYGPRVYLPSCYFPIYLLFLLPFILQYLLFNLYNKNTKNIILLSLSDLTFASGREGIDNPFIALVARFLFVCAGTRRLACNLLLDWYLVLKNWGKYLRYFAASPFPLQGKTNAVPKR